MSPTWVRRGVLATLTFLALAVHAQAPPVPAPPSAARYGISLDLDTAKRVAAAALTAARKAGLNVSVAIVDTGGHLVYFEKMDGAHTASADLAMAKATCAVLFRVPTKWFQDIVAQGGAGLRMLGLPAVVPSEGGTPLIQGGWIVGAIGVSGGIGNQDGQTAQAGADSLK